MTQPNFWCRKLLCYMISCVYFSKYETVTCQFWKIWKTVVKFLFFHTVPEFYKYRENFDRISFSGFFRILKFDFEILTDSWFWLDLEILLKSSHSPLLWAQMSHNFSNFYPLDWPLTTEWTSKFRRWVKNFEPRLPIFSSSGVHYLYP